jgi:D-threo-aldose 1-dehydrogenase
LRALQTNHIDFYLLHEAHPSDVGDELLAFLQGKVREGVIGRFGTGSEAAKVASMTSLCPAFTNVLQFENSVVRPNRRLMAAASESLLITHGALGSSWRQLRDAVASSERLRRSLSDALGADASDPVNLSGAMLAWAARENPKGTVLFSSSRPVNIHSNMAALNAGRFSAGNIETFGGVVAGVFQAAQSS